jgi:hypothetical protein
MGWLRRVSYKNLIELRESLFERVNLIFGAGNFAGLCQQLQPLGGFPRARQSEIPHRTFQRVCRSFEKFRVPGALGHANFVRHFGALLKKYPGKLFQ